MRKVIVLCVLAAVVSGCASIPAGGTGVTLESAIREAAVQMESRLPANTEVALVSAGSSSAQLSEYIVNQLEAALVGSGKLIVLDRANLDKIRMEQGFQLSGDVSDESAKAIGQLLGAGAIVTGSFTDLGDVYHLTIKAINMETAAVAVSYPADITKSNRIRTMLASGGGAGTGVYGGVPASTASGGSVVVPAQAPQGPADGTYTFWPRIQAFQGARAVSVYLDRIVVLRGYMTIYIYATARGDGGYTEMLAGNWSNASLRDMDSNHPARLVGAVGRAGVVYGSVTMCDLSFQNVTGTRLILASADNPPIEFYEIVLEQPDN